MKKLIILIFAALAMLACQEEEIEENRTYLVDGWWCKFNVASLTATICSPGPDCEALFTQEVIIPSYVKFRGKQFKVTSINGLHDQYDITSVIIPDGVTEIGSSTFEQCYKLVSVNIPNSVTSIGERAFYYCLAMTSITIPNGITVIKSGTFYGCTGLTSITIPNSVTSIESSAFLSCNQITSITIPNSVTSIEECAFSHCASLTSLNIGESVVSIGYSAFGHCTKIASVSCRAANPPSLDIDTFYDSPTVDCPLYVPSKCIEAYKADPYWSYIFKSIYAL